LVLVLVLVNSVVAVRSSPFGWSRQGLRRTGAGRLAGVVDGAAPGLVSCESFAIDADGGPGALPRVRRRRSAWRRTNP
ncbi:hypothetical protein ACWKSP_41690, partial [Micromonosporaceae bacterium Da 78-11]